MSTRKMKISSIRKGDGFYIRENYNEKYLDGLRAAIREGQELPLPRVYPDGELEEGRHTVRAHELEGREEILVEVVAEPKTLLEKVIMSTIGHTKTKLPLLPEDYIHTFKNLILQGCTPGEIGVAYRQKRILGNGRLQDYLLQAQARIWGQQITPALDMLNKGKALPEISQTLKIPLHFLKNKIQELAKPKRIRKRTELILFKDSVRDYTNRLDGGLRYHCDKLAALRNDSSVTNEEYLEGLRYAHDKIQNVLNRIEAKMKRFEKEIRAWTK